MFASKMVSSSMSKRWRLMTAAAAVAGGLSFGAAPASAGQDVCEEARTAGLGAIRAQFDGAISSIEELAGRGVDLTKVAVEVNGQYVSLAQLRAKIVIDRANLMATVNSGADDCNRGFEPYQQAANALVTIFSGGLNRVLPERMFRVDVSQILAGYPFGGPNAIVPQIRETLLQATGIGGDAERFFRDPINVLRGGACSFIRNPLQRGC